MRQQNTRVNKQLQEMMGIIRAQHALLQSQQLEIHALKKALTHPNRRRKQNKNNKSPIIKQTGFEIFGSSTKAKDDYEIIKTSINIFKRSKFKKCQLNLSNIEIFHLLVNKLTSLPLRWREKIKRHYSREVYFYQLLNKLSDNKDINPRIVKQDKAKAEQLRKKDPLKIYSGRSLKEILERFDIKNYQDPRNRSNKKSVKIIKDFLSNRKSTQGIK